MHIINFRYPGLNLDYGIEWAAENQMILNNIESELVATAISLSYFEMERSKPYESLSVTLKREKTRINEILSENPQGIDVDLILKREKWARGEIPTTYQHSVEFVFAKSFLYSVDAIFKLLRVLAKVEDIPSEIPVIIKELISKYPNVSKLRNSEAHKEDRIRRIGREGVKIKLKPLRNNIIRSSTGMLISSTLNDNKLGYTMDNGKYGELEVSLDTLNVLTEAYQKILDSFDWIGPAIQFPIE
ncbi:hypothetical protein J2T13_003616 [Paenibacillus sp. DS2015]|uniref:hypothetical protein n=1 Tax=Paenibacillus sp. DS2015 TaxID=3373917 RepID=UPI003D223A67